MPLFFCGVKLVSVLDLHFGFAKKTIERPLFRAGLGVFQAFEGLSKFLIETCSFAKERVDRYLERLKNAKSRTKQRPLDSFFGKPKVEIKDTDKFDPTKKRGAGKAAAKAGSAKRAAPGTAGGAAKKRAR